MPQTDIFTKLLKMFVELNSQATASNVFTQSFDNNTFERIDSGHTTYRHKQALVINAEELYDMCNPKEYHLTGRIGKELKQYNALWYCDPLIKENGTAKRAIRGLIDKNILIPTETTNIYLVNPLYIRKGETFAVLCTTANMLENVARIGREHITDKRPIRRFIFNHNLLSYPGN